jgi:hypothetical protein
VSASEIEPTYEQILERTRSLAERHPDTVQWLDAGASEKHGLPLPFVKVTHRDSDLEHKQIMLVTGGVHGSEECGRATAMAFAEWLARHGGAHLHSQCFLVCTCLNPDGTRVNRFETGAGKNIYTACTIGRKGSPAPEADAVLRVADEYMPECCVDIHGLGGGSVGDTIYVTPGLQGNLSTQIGFAVAYEMSRQAALAGYPQRDPYLQKDYNDMTDGVSWVKKCAWEMNALGFTVEMSEHMYPLCESVWSGLCRLIQLVRIGERIQWYQPYPGYPVDVLTDNGVVALMPHGTTPGERRRSRREIMTAIHEGGIWNVDRDAADHAQAFERTATARFVCREELRTYPARFTIQLLLDRRADIQAVTFNDSELGPDAFHGFEVRRADEGQFVRANINECPVSGENAVRVRYRMPVVPHDPI